MLQVDSQAKTMQVRNLLADELFNQLQAAMKSANAIQLAAELFERNQEIAALQNCPVCKERGTWFSRVPLVSKQIAQRVELIGTSEARKISANTSSLWQVK